MTARRRNCAAAVVLTVLLCSSGSECQAGQDVNDFTTALARLGQPQLALEHTENRDGDANRTAGSSKTATETAEDSQQQLCTSGVSTYSSSRLFENVLAKQTKPLSHKPLWPLGSRDWWTLGIATLAIFIAAGGGIGGGGVLVPLYASMLGFPAKYAVALSNFTIVGGAVANLFFNINRRHSFKPKPLIDWDLILVMEPSTILGAVIGGYLNKVSPAWLAAVLLALLITAVTWKLATRASITWRRESEALAKAQPALAALLPDVEQPLLTHDEDGEASHAQGNPRLSSASARAVAPVAIPSTATHFTDGHAHSPMAYSAVGSFTVGSRSAKPRTESLSARVGTPSALHQVFGTTSGTSSGTTSRTTPGTTSESVSVSSRHGLSQQTQSALLSTGQHRLAASLSDLPQLAEHAEGNEQAEPHSPALTLHRLSQGAGFPASEAPLSSAFVTPDADLQNGFSHSEQTGISQQRPSTPEEKHLQQLLAKESKQVPPAKLGILLLLFAGVLMTDLGKDYVHCNSLAYWGIVLSVIPFILVITLAVRAHLVKKFHRQAGVGYCWQEGDIQWTERNSLVYPAVSSLAGLVAGMFGVGGGIVKGPLMLEMGVLPDVAAATSATMILFTSSSASLVYLSFGGISADYAVALLLLGFVVTLAGQGSTYWLMSRLQRRSIVIIAMASLMLLATAVMYYESIITFLYALHHHTLTERGHICTHRS
ncbi:hypothetical protein WJX77_009207 [Trebouxia sp. C0004]